MARSLLENGNDEEIVRSYRSVQENVKMANEWCDIENKDALAHLDSSFTNSREIVTTLLREIKDCVEGTTYIHSEIAYRNITVLNQSNTLITTETKHLYSSRPKYTTSERRRIITCGTIYPFVYEMLYLNKITFSCLEFLGSNRMRLVFDPVKCTLKEVPHTAHDNEVNIAIAKMGFGPCCESSEDKEIVET